MTLGKEEIQKIVLGALLLVGLVYCYFSMLLGPLVKGHAVKRQQIAELRAKVTEAKKQISRTKTLEASAPAHAVTLKQLTALIPEGAPVSWLPTRIAEFFKQYGVDKAATRLNSEAPEPDVPGFRMTTWGAEFPKADFGSLGRALADFENQQLLAEVATLQIEVLKEDPEAQHVTMTLNHLVKQ
jgi:hypothetical protein